MLTWLGHAGFKIEVTDPTNNEKKIVLIDPWVNSPVCPESEKTQAKADLILVTHAHFDHCSDVPELGKKTNALVLCGGDLSRFMTANGVPSVSVLNKGGSADLGWVIVTMVTADHSGGCPGGNYICEANGFVLKFKDGTPTIYHGGDTNVFSGMQIISDLYEPKVALLPIGGHYTMSPKETAYALNKFLSSVVSVIPMHYGTFPLLKGTPNELKEFLNEYNDRKVNVNEMSYGQKIDLNSVVN